MKQLQKVLQKKRQKKVRIMNEITQHKLKAINSSIYNFQVKFTGIIYQVYFVIKFSAYHHTDYQDFLEDKNVELYCAQYNPETGLLKKGGFVFNLPMNNRRFITQWTAKSWENFLIIAHNRDKALSELENITEALKTSSSASRDLRKIAKQRSRKLKSEVKDCDKKLKDFYSTVALENAVFS